MKIRLKAVFLIQLLFLNVVGYAQLATPHVLSSDMVLQQSRKVPIWGTAKPNERISVSFNKQHVSVLADADGKWKVELQPMKANKKPQQMTIKGEKTSIIYNNIVVGEVWLCSGQSNMEYRMKLIPEFFPPAKGEDLAALELLKPSNEMIRIYNSERDGSPASWQVANGETLVNTSAVGYFFVKAIQKQIDVPVGIISAALGGTQIEAWTTVEAYEESPVFAPKLKVNNGLIDGYRPGDWYNKMVAPLVPYGIRGFLWYQGENNCAKRDKMYTEKFQVLVDSWRKTFNVQDAPFYYVLLAPHIYSDRLHYRNKIAVTAEDLPIFRDQQIKGSSMVPNSDFITISDLVDDLTDNHPSYKWIVGERLARMALTKDYGIKNIIWSGPRINRTDLVGDSIIVTFDYYAEGLKSNNDKRLNWFEIAADDGVFRPALADIKGKNQVVVYHPEIKKPSQVRFAWNEAAIPNLVNSEGLPATQFISTR